MQSTTTDPTLRQVELIPQNMRAGRGRWGQIGVGIVLLLFIAFIATRFAPAITEPDDNGYFAQATRWVNGGTTWFKSSSDAEYIGMHWLWDMKSDTYISRYPPGLPALIAVLYQVGGYKLAMLANPILAVGALVGFYFTARRLVAVGWALTGTVLLATNPTYISHTFAGDSHMAVTFCLIWGTGLLLLWRESGAGWQIFLAGLMLGCIPTIRYPDSLVALGVGAFLVIVSWKRLSNSLSPVVRGEGEGEGSVAFGRASTLERSNPLTLSPEYGGEGTKSARLRSVLLHLFLAVLGSLIPILPLLIRNQLVLGGFWKTGYALTNEQTGFSVAYFKQHAVQYLQILQGDGLGIVFALGLLGIVWMLCAKGSRALGAMFSLFVLPMLLLYMAYYWAPAGNAGATMRFLLPTFPIYILAGLWMLATATRSAPRAVTIALPAVLVGFQLLWGTSTALQSVERMSVSKRALAILTEKARDLVQRDDVLITSGPMLQHADFVRDWKLADLSLVSGRGGGGPGGGGPGGPGGFAGPGGRGGDANAPSPMQMEKQQMLRERYTGSTKEKLAKFAGDVTTWAGGAHSVYVLIPESELRSTYGRDNADLAILEKIELPRRPTPPNGQRGGFGGPGMGGPGGGPGGPPGMGGPGGRQGGPGGGMFGMGNLDGATWVLARWAPRERSAGR